MCFYILFTYQSGALECEEVIVFLSRHAQCMDRRRSCRDCCVFISRAEVSSAPLLLCVKQLSQVDKIANEMPHYDALFLIYIIV